jgi:hypothetical protein
MARVGVTSARPPMLGGPARGGSGRERLVHTFPNADDWVLDFQQRDISRNHRACAHCGELTLSQVSGLSTGDSHVGNRGINRGLRPQPRTRRRLSTVVHRLSTAYPPGLSPGLGITLGRYRLVVPRTFNRKSTPVHRVWATL